MSSCRQLTYIHQCAFGSTVMLCLGFIFFTYYKSDIKFTTFGMYLEGGNNPCECLGKSPTSGSNPNCSLEQHLNPHQSDTEKVQAATASAEPDTILLIWMWPFGFQYELNCDTYNVSRCHLTADKALYHKAHGVLFHHGDIDRNLAALPKEPRPWFQKWVWFNMESPANSGKISGLNNLFNLTCNYRADSNIPVPYGQLEPKTTEGSFQMPEKNKTVCWIVSNWNERFQRVQYFHKLKEYIEIKTYGKAFGDYLGDEDYGALVSSCKFYLSFESSVSKDYITEKLYKPLIFGTVPIVLGPSRHNYEEHVPADSFIHVNDFSSPDKLAERLLYLHQNNTEYLTYFNWRKRFSIRLSYFGKEHACKTCSYLQKNRQCQAFHHLNKWYWG